MKKCLSLLLITLNFTFVDAYTFGGGMNKLLKSFGTGNNAAEAKQVQFIPHVSITKKPVPKLQDAINAKFSNLDKECRVLTNEFKISKDVADDFFNRNHEGPSPVPGRSGQSMAAASIMNVTVDKFDSLVLGKKGTALRLNELAYDHLS